jgi:hypothetical protein
MKKLLILILLLNFSLTNANYNFKKCNNWIVNHCASFILWKATSVKTEKLDDINELLFITNNNFVLLANWLEKIDWKKIINAYSYYDDLDYFYPKKWKVYIIWNWWVERKKDVEKYLNENEKKFFLKLFTDNNILLNREFHWLVEVECKDDNIEFKKNYRIWFDEFTRPKEFSKFNLERLKEYLQEKIKTCENFNNLFWIEEKKEIQKKEKNIQDFKTFFEKILEFLKNLFNSIFI